MTQTDLHEAIRRKEQELGAAHEQTIRFAQDLHCAVEALRDSKNELEKAYLDTVRRLAMAVEFRDNETGSHVLRLGLMSARLAELAGQDAEFVRLLRKAAPMHDVGKIGIPDAILLKPGPLDREEFALMQRHTLIGAELLDNGGSQVMRMARTIALTHHERYNGAGYPKGLSGREIPLEGRIVALVDVFDALCSKRPYKDAFPLDRVLAIMQAERGQHFDPWLLDLLLVNVETFTAIREKVDASSPCSFSQAVEGLLPRPTLAGSLGTSAACNPRLSS